MLEDHTMDKKNRSSQTLNKGNPSETKKSQDVSTNKQLPKQSRRREPARSVPKNEASGRSKPVPQKSKSFDKRPKPRGMLAGGKEGSKINPYEDEPELGSLYTPGSKKQNLNHLLNFQYASPAGQYGSSGGRNSYGGRTQIRTMDYSMGYNNYLMQSLATVHKHKYNKEQFLQANCQFVVCAGEDYAVHLADPDQLVKWEFIQQIRGFGNEDIKCPICLDSPRAAQMTRCGHTYCWPCILHYLALSDKTWRKCPICYEAIHPGDLKSFRAVIRRPHGVAQEVTFQLMKRERGSTIVTPLAQWDFVVPDVPMNVSETQLDTTYAKLLTASVDNILDIINEEESELGLLLEELRREQCPTLCFTERALELLHKRRTDVLEKMNNGGDVHNTDMSDGSQPVHETIGDNLNRENSAEKSEPNGQKSSGMECDSVNAYATGIVLPEPVTAPNDQTNIPSGENSPVGSRESSSELKNKAQQGGSNENFGQCQVNTMKGSNFGQGQINILKGSNFGQGQINILNPEAKNPFDPCGGLEQINTSNVGENHLDIGEDLDQMNSMNNGKDPADVGENQVGTGEDENSVAGAASEIEGAMFTAAPEQEQEFLQEDHNEMYDESHPGRSRYESVSSEEPGAHGTTSIRAEDLYIGPSAHSTKPSRFFYFYQAQDGQHLYLHAVNVRMLEMSYGSLEHCPPVLTGVILEKETGSMTAELRNRLRYLQHLPVTCQFEVAEIQLRPPLVTPEAMDRFRDQLVSRERRRAKRAREDRRRAAKIDEVQYAQMRGGVGGGANRVRRGRLYIDSRLQFPECGVGGVPGLSSALGSASVSTESSRASSPRRPESPLTTALMALSLEQTNSSTTSFAQRLRAGSSLSANDTAMFWPSVGERERKTTVSGEEAESGTSHAYSISLAQIMGAKNSPAVAQNEQITSQASGGQNNNNSSGSKKKKRKQQTLLFATGGMMVNK